ncbi:hypothetical protein C7974DRAFT_373549 [Boeremia exigua]|uniref:uncharacterized protein n=1 Tax=Boeremia exigua TaxID=749465 RepID=UPI001E8E0B13|nr:uncharacterized protein C7974DRAFT_373549 [Boeremia exigua]KAH6639295.1 hypothetical protein C7974DRAFT_373549 [Boeremia exigua]
MPHHRPHISRTRSCVSAPASPCRSRCSAGALALALVLAMLLLTAALRPAPYAARTAHCIGEHPRYLALRLETRAAVVCAYNYSAELKGLPPATVVPSDHVAAAKQGCPPILNSNSTSPSPCSWLSVALAAGALFNLDRRCTPNCLPKGLPALPDVARSSPVPAPYHSTRMHGPSSFGRLMAAAG